MELESIKKVYFIGIKGAGMAALAEVFLKMGKEVAGSDVKEKFFTDQILQDLGINVHEGFSIKNITEERPNLIIYSTAYNNANNEEVRFALTQNSEVVSYPEVLGKLMENKFGLAVCGTHGKTTTTAMLALAMKEAGSDPTAIVGAKINQIGSNALVGRSQYFLLEADEYQNKFKHYDPIGVILTSLDFDHPDFFKNFKEYKEVFKDFIRKIPRHGFLVAFGGDADVVEVACEARCKLILYDAQGHFRIEENERLKMKNVVYVEAPAGLRLKVLGDHNIQNATGVYAVCRQLKLDKDSVLKALNDYQGTARRMELIGRRNGAEVIDDYAHHPREIKATLKAIRQKYSHKNIVCVFQPHTFSRTRSLFSDFSQSFSGCDEVYILDIFGSAREKQGGVSSVDLVREIKKYKPKADYIGNLQNAYDFLKDKINEKDLLVILGAGEGDKLASRLVKEE
jgi:UDP-N-acetylmuramate--alanine ligase